MRTLTLYSKEPVKYLRQTEEGKGIVLIVDPEWVPDLALEYTTEISLSDASTDPEAVSEVMKICDIHCGGVIVGVSGDCRKIVATVAAIYGVDVRAAA